MNNVPVTVTDNFSTNTGQWTNQYRNTQGTLSFLTGPPTQGQMYCPSIGFGQGFNAWQNSNMSSLTSGIDQETPSIFLEVDIPATGGWINSPTGGDYANICVGLVKDGANMIVHEAHILYGTNTYDGDILQFISGGQANNGGWSITSAVVPDKMGFGMLGNVATMWLSIGGIWQFVSSWDTTSQKDYTASGALTGFVPCCGQANSFTLTFELNALVATVPMIYPTALTDYEQLIIADGAISYAPLNDYTKEARDIVQNCISQWTIQGGAGNVPPTFGASISIPLDSQCAQYQSSTNSVGVAFSNPLNPGSHLGGATSTTISAEGWIQTTDMAGGGTGVGASTVLLFSDISGGGLNDWGLGFYLNMQPTWGGGTPGGGGGDVSLTSATALNDGNWHHVVATWDTVAGVANIYIDGVLDCTSSTGWTCVAKGGGPNWWSGKNAANWLGKCAHLALYNVVLTPTQVNNHYQLGKNGIHAPTLSGVTVGSTNNLSWSPGTPSFGQWHVYRDGTLLATVSVQTYSDTPPFGSYSYQVATWDGTNEGPLSNTVNLGTSGTDKSVYGKFAGARAFPPTLLIDAKGIKPRIYMPHENTTVQT